MPRWAQAWLCRDFVKSWGSREELEFNYRGWQLIDVAVLNRDKKKCAILPNLFVAVLILLFLKIYMLIAQFNQLI
jgi:hypothetical protein